MVPADSEITSVADLRKKIVFVGEEESDVLQNTDRILLAYGLTREMLTSVYWSFSVAAGAMLEGNLDALFITAGAPTRAIENLAQKMNIRVLSMNCSIIENLIDTDGLYTPCTIPAGIYAGQDKAEETVGVKSVLVASEQLSADTVQALTASLLGHADELQYSTPGESRPDLGWAEHSAAFRCSKL